METFDQLMRKSYAFNPREFEVDSRWDKLRNLYDLNFVQASKKKIHNIPKKIHQIWLGSKLPEKYKVWAESWKKFHPDWEYRLWTDDDVDEIEMKNRRFYNTISNFGPKSDFLRYHILNQFGGLYIDTDFECLKPFDPLTYADFITGIGYPMKPELYVGLIASIPHHPITERLVSEINKGRNDIELANVLQVISSYFFTRNFFAVIGDYMPGVLALPPDYFYPFPNDKGHEHRDGRKEIKDVSYAIHYWEVSWSSRNGHIDWIQGEKFIEIADMVYSPKQKHIDDYLNTQNTFDASMVKEFNIIYTHTLYIRQLFNLLQYLPGKYVVITHNSDINIDDSFEIPENVIRWYGQNVNTNNKKVKSIPIGLPNSMWDPKRNKRVNMVEGLKRQRTYRNLVYMNHLIKTNSKKRQIVYDILKGKKWVTVEGGSGNVPFSHYIDQVRNHKFVICPEGNGIDTHRIWEALYMGSIPIVIRDLNNRFYEDLPICFIDDWNELTPEFLNMEFDRIKGREWNLEKLNFEYWRKLITKQRK